MRFLRAAALCALALSLSGCPEGFGENGYIKYYRPVTDVGAPGQPLAATASPQLRQSSGDLEQDSRAMYEQGYALIGTVIINGPEQDPNDALEQARQVHAAYVLVSSQYESTATATLPYTTPNTTNTYFNGNAGGTPYNGNATSFGSTTTMVPYSVNRYDQSAFFFAPMERTGIGIKIAEVPPELKAKTGTNSGILVVAVRKESPAFTGDIVPGDVILAADGKPVTVDNSLQTLKPSGKPIAFKIWRQGGAQGKTLEKTIPVPLSW
jgi:hypothetical protein